MKYTLKIEPKKKSLLGELLLTVLFCIMLVAVLTAVSKADPCPALEPEFKAMKSVFTIFAFEEPYLLPGGMVMACDKAGNTYGSATVGSHDGEPYFLLNCYGEDPATEHTPGFPGFKRKEIISLWYYNGIEPVCHRMRLAIDSPLPEFRDRGAITIHLAPPGDMNGDAQLDALDMAILVDVVFRGGGDSSAAEYDLNNDGRADIQDVILLSAVIFRGEDPRILQW